MKPETDPITEDEWLIRLAWHTWFTGRTPIISPNLFEPRSGRHPDNDGISLFRKDCLKDPADALLVIPGEKRIHYGIVQIPISLVVKELGFSVTPSRIPEVPGHVVIPELSITAYLADKARFTPIKLRLAEVASANVLRPPSQASG